MRDSYQRAHELHTSKPGGANAYYILNWLTGDIAAREFEPADAASQEELLGRIETLEASAREADSRKADFWSSITLTDCLLLRSLAERNLSDRVDGIVKGYRSAWLRGATARDFRSVLEHVEFLSEMAAATSASNGGRPLRGVLGSLYERLSALSD
jgi:hypothetical protein